jgi:hypothetical protein
MYNVAALHWLSFVLKMRIAFEINVLRWLYKFTK